MRVPDSIYGNKSTDDNDEYDDSDEKDDRDANYYT